MIIVSQCLPVHIDVGTNREALHTDPAYMGLKRPRDRSAAYDDLLEEFFDACQAKYGPRVLMQVPCDVFSTCERKSFPE